MRILWLGGVLGLVLGARPAVAADTLSGVLEVKFREGLAIRVRGGVPMEMTGGRPVAVPGALRAGTALIWERAFPDVAEADLERLSRAAAARQSGRGQTAADLNLYARVRLAEPGEIGAVEKALRALPEIEAVERVPVLYPAAAPDYLDPENGAGVWQRYVDAAPDGVNARHAWSNGLNGAGVRICDVEYDWNETHADLPAISNLVAHHEDAGHGDNHGTAVFGQLAARDNGSGVRGIAHGSEFYFAGIYATGRYSAANAILSAASVFEAGDVILLELQMTGPAGQYVPVEWNRTIYDAIVAAVAQGIVVVEAAGNGSQNLDDVLYATGNGGHWPFLPENDSGAILVGAGAPPGYPVPRARLGFSNHGHRVDVQGWGYSVVTAGYGYLYEAEGKDQWYTARFSGTSSASPMTAGAAAVIQQAYRAAFGTSAPPAVVRQLLRATGTPQAGTDNIGPFPDLCAAIRAVQSPEDGDGDGIFDWLDNCPGTFNPGQADADGDGHGDVCDNCPAAFNPGQEDADGDGTGDACDPDLDGDGRDNGEDNCPGIFNPGQEDVDGDGRGDACDPCQAPMPDYHPGLAAGSPSIAGGAGSPNRPGEAFDLSAAGGGAGTLEQCGFGGFGEVYFNYDGTGLFLGGAGVDMTGDNNGLILFLGVNTLSDDRLNLWDQSGRPQGLDGLHNVAFTEPMDLALVLGDEYGDGTFPDFNLGNGYNFGQGLFYLSATSFVPVADGRLSQFDGSGTNAVSGTNDDGNRLTDRWEAFIPWSRLGAAGAHSVTSLVVAGVIASDGESGPDRYLSGNVLAASADSSVALNEQQNYGFAFVTLTPYSVDMTRVDSDGDGMTDVQERAAGTDPASAQSVFRAAAVPAAGEVAVATVTGRLYGLFFSTNLLEPGWQSVPGALDIAGDGTVLTLTNAVAGDRQRSYRIRVRSP